MQASSEVLLVIGGGLVGAFITGSYQFVYDWFTRPKLIVDYEGAEGRNRVETERPVAERLVLEVYIRIRVRNTGRRPAKNCLIFLTGIEEVHPSGTTLAPFYDAAPLSWAGLTFYSERCATRRRFLL